MLGSGAELQHAGLALSAWQSILSEQVDIEIGLGVRNAFRVSAAHGDAGARPREVTYRAQDLVNNRLDSARNHAHLQQGMRDRELPRA